MAIVGEEENDWEHLNRTNWRGLGLADPIKTVEVFFVFCAYFLFSNHPHLRTNGYYCLHF